MAHKANHAEVREYRLPVETAASMTETAWQESLRDLLHDCADSAPVEQAGRIRHAHALLSHGAAGERLPLDSQAIENLLALGAWESAVLALMGGESAFMLSRGASGTCLASVALPDGSEEMVAEGSTLALALLAAYLSSLIADAEQGNSLAPRHPVATGMRLN